MIVYLDASILVALMTADALSARADAFMRGNIPPLVVSNFAITEFCSAVARRVRIGETKRELAGLILSGFDSWVRAEARQVEATSGDIALAQAFLRRLDLPLRTGDAINIAIAQRLDSTLATFDEKMATSARAIGLPVCAA